MATKREFISLLLGSAAVVGFETTFGLSKWGGFQPPPLIAAPDIDFVFDLRPGAINRVPAGKLISPIGSSGAWLVSE
jgi:hypothetical protein